MVMKDKTFIVLHRGLHHEATFVRSRLFYLFRQFVHALKKHMAPLVDTVLMSIQVRDIAAIMR